MIFSCFFQPAIAAAPTFEKLKDKSDIQHIKINDEISLDIYSPQGPKSKTFPVLYVMDGQRYFYHALAYQKALRDGADISPEYIVVGINTSNVRNGRRDFFHNRAGSTIDLIRSTIVPYIDRSYPSSESRAYFGWQFAAILGLELFNSDPLLFEAYFLASGQHYSQDQLIKLEKHLKESQAVKHHFYLSLGKTEEHTLQGHRSMVEIFNRYKSKGIQWKFSYFDRFSIRYDHHTTPLESLTHGLEWYFSDYPDLTFYSVEDIEKFGGAAAVKAYYANRAQRYSVSNEVGKQAKFSMFRHAAQENNYRLFSSLEKEMGPFEATGWYGLFAQFFHKNKQYQRAAKLYKSGLTDRPEDHRYWAGLAETYESQKQFEEALKYYRGALRRIPSDHASYKKYQQAIVRLEKLSN
ncbi:tetratricopeptide repeat protein [Pseudoteredinibacter isoporae]|uniref:tetratricopeptide repeat protein n=1 Tax=Pseudoteredinibacter isoporae TaxID=570281 RepID=UPI001C8831D4|nr:tetratricopeptide repeat protein [Pseudoteredinibacter isoporae]